MRRYQKTRGPTAKTVKMLKRGYELIQSVPYKVSLRWLFYALYQEGYYKNKGDYKSTFTDRMITARRKHQYGWHPNSLADETRDLIIRSGGHEVLTGCISDLVPSILRNIRFYVDHFYHQERYVMVGFEARAMAQQFLYYTKDIDLVPFGGDPSFPIKWDTAKRIEYARELYDKHVLLLYFGDFDKKGEQIVNSALNDITEWCDRFFEVRWCGLTEKQALQYGIPEKPDKPGKYQWEALKDADAAEIIQGAVANYVDLELMEQLNAEAKEQENIWRDKVANALESL